MGTPTIYHQAQTPPKSPYLFPSKQPISLEDLQNVLVEINKAVGKLPDSVNPCGALDQNTSAESDKPRLRAVNDKMGRFSCGYGSALGGRHAAPSLILAVS